GSTGLNGTGSAATRAAGRALVDVFGPARPSPAAARAGLAGGETGTAALGETGSGTLRAEDRRGVFTGVAFVTPAGVVGLAAVRRALRRAAGAETGAA